MVSEQMVTLSEARAAQGWSLRALAKYSCTTYITVRDIELHKHRARPNAAWKLARALGMAPENIVELRPAIESYGKIGDPCECGLPGEKVPAKNPNARRLATSHPCQGCGLPRVYQPQKGNSRHVPYCEKCSRTFWGILHLERKDSPFASVLADALKRNGIPLSVACSRVGITPETVHRWIRGTFTPFYDSVKALVDELDAPELFNALENSKIGIKFIKFTVKCPNCPEPTTYRGRGGTKHAGQVNPDHIGPLREIDWEKFTAVKYCMHHTFIKGGPGQVKAQKAINRKGIVVDGVWIRGKKSRQLRAKQEFKKWNENHSKERRDEHLAKMQEGNRGTKRSLGTKIQASLGRLKPVQAGTFTECWWHECVHRLLYYHNSKQDREPSFHESCLAEYISERSKLDGRSEWPPSPPGHLHSHKYLADSFSMAVQYAQFYKKAGSGKGKSGPQLAKEFGLTLSGVLSRIDAFMSLLPTVELDDQGLPLDYGRKQRLEAWTSKMVPIN